MMPAFSAGPAIAALTVRARRRIVSDFVAAGAVSADHAVPYVPRDRRIDRRMFRRLARYGVIVEPVPGRYYLDADRLHAFRLSLRRRALGVMAALGAIAAAAFTLDV